MIILKDGSKNMLNFKCCVCKKELKEPGALLFSPPEIIDPEAETIEYDDTVKKYHICVCCYWDIMGYILIDLKK